MSDHCGAKLVKKLVQARYCVLAFWLVAICVSAPFAVRLVDAARFNFKPVPGTRSYEAQLRMHAAFPHLTYQDVEIVVMSCTECHLGIIANDTATGNLTRYVVDALRSELLTLAGKHPELSFSSMSALDFAGSQMSPFSQKNPLLSDDKHTALFQFSWEVRPEQQKQALLTFQDFSDTVDRLHNEASGKMHGYSLALTGPLALFKTSLDSTKKDMASKDLFVLPVALLILCWRVRSWRLTLLTLLNVGTSICVSFALFLPVATYAFDISPVVPSVMVFLSIALSIDYSLFLFTRFVEEVQGSKAPHAALEPMLLHSGEVVCLSGSVLILCYLGVLLFPGKAISSVGMGAAVSIFMSMAANLTISPCAIAAFPKFFAAGLAPGSPTCCCVHRQRGGESRSRSAWFWWGRTVTTWPCTIIVPLIAYGIMAPVCLQLLRYQESFNNSLMFPATGAAADAYERIQEMSSPGALAPIFILQPGNVKSNEWFAQNCAWAHRLMKATAGKPYELHAQDFLGVSVIPNPFDATEFLNLTWNSSEGGFLPSAETLLENKTVMQGVDIGAAYKALWSKFVSSGNDTGMLHIQPGFDPYGPNMRPLINALREALDHAASGITSQFDVSIADHMEDHQRPSLLHTLEDQEAISRKLQLAGSTNSVYLYSPLIILFDIMTITYGRLPLVLFVVFATCFLSIGIVFRAAFVPFKLCLTVLVPLCMVYGTGVLVYQDGALDFLGWRSLEGTGGIYWAQPVFTVTILTGLALDYDIFLFARVLELRLEGYTNPAAVAGAMALTGPTITAAGLIMASAFGGLLLTDIPANNQIGFLMSFAVLMDTFVIRTCLVPAVLVLASKLNYWPRQLPPESKTMSDMKALLCKSMPSDLSHSSGVSLAAQASE